MKIKKTPINRDGDLFVVRDSEGADIALGLSARGGHTLGRLGYFFRFTGLEYINPESISLAITDVIYIQRFSGLHIRKGSWPTIGKLAGFLKDDWPVPLFVQTNIFTKEKEYNLYDENAKLHVSRYTEHTIPFDPNEMIQAEDGMAGAIFVEHKLKIILDRKN